MVKDDKLHGLDDKLHDLHNKLHCLDEKNSLNFMVEMKKSMV